MLGVTGSIAAYKAGLLARLLVDAGADVRVILTHSAERFVGADTFAALTGNPVQTSLWDNPGEVVHVHLAHDIDVAVVAPATANVIAKLATGLADDLLTSTLLETTSPLILAPAMHTGMWQHPATAANAATLAERGAVFVGPVVGALAAGDEGLGRMAEPEDIFRAVERAIASRHGSGRRADGRHGRPDPRADRPRALHREPLDGEDGRRGRRRGVVAGRGRPSDSSVRIRFPRRPG